MTNANAVTKDVWISIHGKQDYEDSHNAPIELTTAGKLTRTEQGYQLSYEETALTGMEGTLTRFDIAGRQVTLTRTGEICSEMVFEPGVRHLSLYRTPFGNMEVGVAARKVYSTIGDEGGELEVNYSIDIDHEVAGESTFSLRVQETRLSQ